MTTIDDILLWLFQNGQRNKRAMINLIDCVHASKATFTVDRSYSNLKFGEGLGITKADNGPIFLIKLYVRKSVDPRFKTRKYLTIFIYERFFLENGFEW